MFRRSGHECPGREFRHSGLYPDETRRGVDVLAAQRGDFAPAQAAEDRQQDKQPVLAIGERIGKVLDT